MPIEKTKLIPGYFYHIYNRAVEGNLLFREEKNYPFFISKIKKYMLPVSDILAYCLMPNHYHMVLKIKSERFSESMRKLALSYVVSFNNLYNRKGHLFQGSYQRIHIQDPVYLLNLSMYIHMNPIKANLENNAEDWKYSSYSEYIGKEKVDFIHPEIILDMVSDDLFSSITDQQLAYRYWFEDWKEELKGLCPL